MIFFFDSRTPFKNKTNACKRLVRYHVFHELGPTPHELEKEEDELETHAQQLLSKFHQMINKYHYLLLMVGGFFPYIYSNWACLFTLVLFHK